MSDKYDLYQIAKWDKDPNVRIAVANKMSD